MKLIFVNRYFYPDISATSQLLTDLALDQTARSREVHVITSRQLYENAKARLPADEDFRGIRIHRIWTTQFGRANLAGRAIDYATFFLSAAVLLWTLGRAGDVIVAETDPPLISVAAAWVARSRGARLVNWLQDIFPEIAERLRMHGLPAGVARIARRLRDYSLRTARVNVALGESMATVVRRLVPDAASTVTAIPNWADGTRIHPVERTRNDLRTLWGLGERFVVGYSGNMGQAHDFQTILEACELLRKHSDVIFLFVGSGRQREWVESEAGRRSLPNVLFRPYQPPERLAMSLSAADVHLITLKPALEGLIVPSKFYGIAAAGRPALFIGDEAGELARIIHDADCGRCIEDRNAIALADAILALRDHPDDVVALGRRARGLFDREYDARIALERWNSVLEVAAVRSH